MKNISVMTVFGTRPEAIKLAPVIQQLRNNPYIHTSIVVTGQHREMLDQVLELFSIIPDWDLDLMKANQDLSSLTASIFTNLDPILTRLQPDWLLVQGDTTTVMVAALNAYYHHIKVGHVEAGLRTGDKWQPFPEEVNRRITGVLADLHFAPTEWAMQNLINEGVSKKDIKITGNTIVDALQQISNLPMPKYIKDMLVRKGIIAGEKVLVTVTAHRRENFGQPIKDICYALKDIANAFQKNIEIIYPVHLNPNIKEPVFEILNEEKNITLLPPLEYIELVHLLKHSYIVLTDSGGIQEEATSLGIPCLVLRTVTERPEGVHAGVLKLVGTDHEKIFIEFNALMTSPKEHEKMAHTANPYGDGTAAQKIVQALLSEEK